jgi:hypothetical protein
MEVPTQAVFWKQSWTDEWVEVPELWCTEATWAVAPTISTATIRHRYGDVLEYAAAAFAARAPLRNQVRVYVRVDFNVNKRTLPIRRTWLGAGMASLRLSSMAKMALFSRTTGRGT